MDLDGTIINVWKRYYSITSSYLLENNMKLPMFDQYVAAKKKYENDAIVFPRLLDEQQWNSLHSENYQKYKREHLEAMNYLMLDTVIGDISVFRKRFLSYRFVLLTIRSQQELLFWQLHKLGIFDCFEQIYCLKPNSLKNPKLECISSFATKNDIIIGDSDIDMECGVALQMGCIFVKSGLFSEKKIKHLISQYPIQVAESYMDYCKIG
jgi:phosphoglycolate phosphatase-like HAD superfamily hydrolase